MNIILALSNYSNLTGSEIYTYELAKTLKEKGHNPIILANTIGGEIAKHTDELKIPIYSFFDHPDFNLDIVHSAQPGPTAYCLSHFDTPIVCTIHSQLIWERPLKDERIKKYICIRPEIKQKIVDIDRIDEKRIKIIYNGVDTKRFNQTGGRKGNYILFVGTNDYLRQNVIKDLVLRAKKEGKELRLIGAGFPEESRWNIEEPTKDCYTTASVYLGRSTIEGFMCGKPGWIYDVDDKGNIKDIVFAEVPDDETLKHFDINYMTDRIVEVYKQALYQPKNRSNHPWKR